MASFGSRHMVAANVGEMIKKGRAFGSLVLSLLWQPIEKQVWHPGPLPKRPKSTKGLYRLILCPLAWFLQVLLGCSCPSAWHFMAQNFGITCQPECVTLCSDPGRVRKTKYDLIASWFTHLHPNACMLISIQLSCLQISFTSLTKLCILALLSLQNVQITLFWVVLNKTSKGPDSWGDLLKATS